jgi:hypothetical protein
VKKVSVEMMPESSKKKKSVRINDRRSKQR